MEKWRRINLSDGEDEVGLALGVVSSLWVSEPPPGEQPPTLAAFLSPGKRPPPEPPPPPRCTAPRRSCCKPWFRNFRPLPPKSAMTEEPPVVLFPVRPPPKPIWPDYVTKFVYVSLFVLFKIFLCGCLMFVELPGSALFRVCDVLLCSVQTPVWPVCVMNFGAVFLFVLFKIFFCVCLKFAEMPGSALFSVCDVLFWSIQTLVWISVEFIGIDDMSQESVAFGYKVCSGLTVIIINLIILFNQQVSPIFVFNLAHLETTDSRSEPATAKDMIRNWIDLKTVDSLLYLAFNPVWKIFAWVLGLYVWLDFGLLFLVHQLCIAAIFWVGWTCFLLAKSKSVWWEDIDCVVSLMADPKFGIYTTFQRMSALWFKMNGTKATYGRFEPALVTKMIRSWIDIKTVAPLVMNQAGMKWMCWLLVYVTWIDVNLDSTTSMYFHRIDLDQLIELDVLSGWGMPLDSLLILGVTFWFFL